MKESPTVLGNYSDKNELINVNLYSLVFITFKKFEYKVLINKKTNYSTFVELGLNTGQISEMDEWKRLVNNSRTTF